MQAKNPTDRTNSEDTKLLKRLAKLYTSSGNHSEALEVYDKLLKEFPGDRALLIEKADCLMAAGRILDAEECLERVLEIKPGDPRAFLSYSKLYGAMHDRDKEISFLMLAVNSVPAAWKLRLALAAKLREYGDLKGAQAQYLEVLKIKPHLETAKFDLGLIYMGQDKFDEAAREFSEIITNNPSAFDAHFNLGNLYFRTGKYDAAIAHFTVAVRKNDLAAKSSYLMGQCFLKLQDFDSAIVTYERLIDSEPDNISFLKSLAEAYVEAKEFDMSYDVYERLVELQPKSSEFRLRLAEHQNRFGKHSSAKMTLKALFQISPGHIGGHRLLGEVYAANSEYKAAAEEFERILLVNPAYSDVYISLGKVYRATGRYEDELSVLRKAYALGNKEPSYLLRLGELEYDKGNEACFNKFERLIEIAPESNYAKEAEYYLRHGLQAA